MDVLQEAFAWLNDPLNWTGRNGVIALTKAHIAVSVLAVMLGAVVSLPLALWLGHRRRAHPEPLVRPLGQQVPQPSPHFDGRLDRSGDRGTGEGDGPVRPGDDLGRSADPAETLGGG